MNEEPGVMDWPYQSFPEARMLIFSSSTAMGARQVWTVVTVDEEGSEIFADIRLPFVPFTVSQ